MPLPPMPKTSGWYAPEILGWVRLKDSAEGVSYRKPDGQTHTFPPGQPPKVLWNAPVDPPGHPNNPLPGQR